MNCNVTQMISNFNKRIITIANNGWWIKYVTEWQERTMGSSDIVFGSNEQTNKQINNHKPKQRRKKNILRYHHGHKDHNLS